MFVYSNVFILIVCFIFILVCKLWKEAASKQWRKITEISYHDDLETELREKSGHDRIHVGEISAKTAEKIMHHTAPFVEVLSASVLDDPEKLFSFGPFVYNVKDHKADATLKLLAANATNLKEVLFSSSDTTDLFKFFIGVNKVNKYTFDYGSNFYEDVPTDTIEELTMSEDPRNMNSFEGVSINYE